MRHEELLRNCSGVRRTPASVVVTARARLHAGLIVIDGDLVGHRIALAGEDEAARDLVVLEREIDVHVDLARDELRAARRAHAALARIRQLDAGLEPGLEDALLALLQRERARRAVEDHRDLALGVPGLGRLARLVLVLRDARGEALDPDLRVRDSRAPRSASATACIMPSGPQTKTASTCVEVDPVREQRVGLRAVDAAVQELDVLRLARQHVDQVEAGEVGVLERGELLPEHHRARRAIAVEQREIGLRLGGERRLDDRQRAA